MTKLSEKIIELRLATRRAAMCENASGAKKNTLSLKSKVLFLLKDKPCPPSDLISALCINKTNLALLLTKMQVEGLVAKAKKAGDRREIAVTITEKGKDYLYARLEIVENMCLKAFDEAEYGEALSKLDDALSVLEFI